MPIRSFRFPSDFRILEQLTPQAYQYPKESGWVTRGVQEQESKNFVDLIRAAKRLWPLIALGQVLFPRLRNSWQGFIWEEEKQPVGLIATGQGANRSWWIANLAVLPAYRRRGIASQLVRAAIDVARSCGAEAVTLDVIAENIPAGQLYRKLGFEIYNGSVEFLAPNNPLPLIDIPPGYDVRDLKSGQWQPHYELAKRVMPANVQKFRPITVRRFQPSWIDQWLNRIVEPASGISRSGIAIYLREDRQPCATAQLTARTRQGGFHELDIRLDPAHPKVAVTILNAGISRLQNSHPNHSIHVHVYSWQKPLMLAAQEIGCSKLHTYHTMGMNVNSVGRLDLVGR